MDGCSRAVSTLTLWKCRVQGEQGTPTPTRWYTSADRAKAGLNERFDIPQLAAASQDHIYGIKIPLSIAYAMF